MKVSVSLPDSDVAFLDEIAAKSPDGSRSAVLRRAIRLLRHERLGSDYADAWEEWADDSRNEVWETASSDGLLDDEAMPAKAER